MTASVAVSVMEQWQGDCVYMMKECETDDSHKNDKTEKEKEFFAEKHDSSLHFEVPAARPFKGRLHPGNDRFTSDGHAFLPEIPPKAAPAAPVSC